jgi:aarF domain-containing kinase
VARDLQTLGFIPYEAGDPVALGIVPPLGRILSQLSGGGGATKLNIDAVMAELEELGRSYPFQVCNVLLPGGVGGGGGGG